MYANRIGQVRNHFRYLKTDRFAFIDNAMRISINRINKNSLSVRVSTMKGSRDHCGRKTRQGANLDCPLRSNNTSKGSQKKRIPQTDRSWVRATVLDRTQKCCLTRWWDSFSATQKLGQTPIVHFVGFQRIKFTYLRRRFLDASEEIRKQFPSCCDVRFSRGITHSRQI